VRLDGKVYGSDLQAKGMAADERYLCRGIHKAIELRLLPRGTFPDKRRR